MKSSCLGAACLLLSLVAMSSGGDPVHAQEILSASPDVSIDRGMGVVAADEDVIVDNQLGIVFLTEIGPLPDGSEVSAFGLNMEGQLLIAFETTTLLPGDVVVRPGDIVSYRGGQSYKLEFDSAQAGVPSNATTDAVSSFGNLLILSFDTTVDLGGGLVAADEDLVSWDGMSFESAMKGSAMGISSALDVDAAHYVNGSQFLVSFDTSGAVGGVAFDDEDVLRWDGSSWIMEFDASTSSPAWPAADLDALLVSEPAFIGMVSVGCGWLASFGRRRSLLLGQSRHRSTS